MNSEKPDDQVTNTNSEDSINNEPSGVNSDLKRTVLFSENETGLEIGVQSEDFSDSDAGHRAASEAQETVSSTETDIYSDDRSNPIKPKSPPTEMESIIGRLVELEKKLDGLAFGIETKIENLAETLERESSNDDERKNLRITELSAQYRKTAEELTDYRKSVDDIGVMSLIDDLLPIYDTLVEQIKGQDQQSWNQPIFNILLTELLDAMEVKGVVPFKSDEFDHRRHSVVELVKTDQPELDGKVADSIKKGFEKNGIIVIRPEMIRRYQLVTGGDETNE